MRLLLLFTLALGNFALAQAPEQLNQAVLVQAHLTEHSADELHAKLELAEVIVESAEYKSQGPVVFILDGAEVQLFLRERYRQHKALVDLSSRLAAFATIEIKVGQNYLRSHALTATDLPSFISVIDSAAVEKTQLEKAGYIRF